MHRRTGSLSEYQQLRRCLNLLVPNPEHRQLLLHHLERTISETVALRESNAQVIARKRQRKPRNASQP